MTRPSFFAELRRRNVIRAALLYIGVVWALSQGIAQLAPVFDVPNRVVRWLIVAGVVGFPFWLAFAWFYEWTPEGLKLEREVEAHESIAHRTGRKLDFAIIAVLAVAVVLLVTDKFVLRKTTTPEAPTVATSAAAIPEIASDPSIAVLPLVNMSDDKANEYFSDGISEELLNLLSKVPKLRVIARTSSFSFKGKELGIPEIARTLHVASVLEGSVRKSGDKVRITVQLIRASDGSHLWSETYDRTLDDIFKVQDEIAAAVVGQLQVKLLGAAPTAKPVDPRIYPLILQAQALLDQQTAVGRTQAIEAYKQALATSPNEARAWAGLARAYGNQIVFGEVAAPEGKKLASDAADRALASDPANVIALGILGRIAADVDRDLPAAARYYQRAFEFEPSNLLVINAAALLIANIGRLEEARVLLQYRVAHDPASPTAYNNLAGAQYSLRRWDDSIASLRTTLRLSPEFPSAHYQIAVSMLQGRRDAAGALKECELEAEEGTRDACKALALHSLGRTGDSDAALAAFIERYGKNRPSIAATVYAWRGHADAAFEWLDRGAEMGDPQATIVPTEPLFDPVRQDPRWLQYLRKIGFAPEQVEKIEFKVTLPQ